MKTTGPCTDKENIYGCILGRERINEEYGPKNGISELFRRLRLLSILLLPCQIFRWPCWFTAFGVSSALRNPLGRAHQKLRKLSWNKCIWLNVICKTKSLTNCYSTIVISWNCHLPSGKLGCLCHLLLCYFKLFPRTLHTFKSNPENGTF